MTLEPETGSRGWLVIQRRVSDSVSFDRDRADYKRGFGQLDGNFWLGLERIKRIIDSGSNGYELYFGMGEHDSPQTTNYAKWKSFSLGTEANDWTLTVSTATTSPDFTSSSSIVNSMAESNNQKFTTKDDDNDGNGAGNCAVTHEGGWWFKNCHETNPNGKYYPTSDNSAGGDYTGIVYEGYKGKAYSLKTIVMAIRPK